MRHRLVTSLCVVDYALTEADGLKYAEDRSSRWEGVYLKLLAATALTDESILGVIGNHSDDLDAAFRALEGVVHFARFERTGGSSQVIFYHCQDSTQVDS